MTEEERQFTGNLALVAGLSRSESRPATPDADAIMKDQTRFRMVRTGRGQGVIIPPRPTP